MAHFLRHIKFSSCRPLGLFSGSCTCNANICLKNVTILYSHDAFRRMLSTKSFVFNTVKGPTINLLNLGKTEKIEEKLEVEPAVASNKPVAANVNDILCDLNNGPSNLPILKVITYFTSLSKLAVQGSLDLPALHNDVRFQMLCKQFQSQCDRLSDHFMLINGLKSLLDLKLDPDSKLVSFVENELLWQTRKMSMKSLSICLGFHVHHQQTELQKKVLWEIVSSIQKRWIEINEVLTILKIYENCNLFQESFLSKLEDRSLEFTEKMTVEELLKFLRIMANHKKRPTPLLKSISYHINQKPEKLTVKQSVDLLHALNTLSFPDTILLQRISNDLTPEINDKLKRNVITSILTCCGQMKWKDPGLLEACCLWILDNSKNCRPQEFVACLLTLAKVNYYPEDADKLFDLIIANLEAKAVTTLIWLDVVWSLCILSRANQDHIASVLDPSFYNPLIESLDPRNVNTKLKLLNVYAVAKTQFSNLNVQFDSILCKIENKTVPDDKHGKPEVLNALNNFVPRGKFLATNLFCNFGFTIDAEFIIDANGKPLPIIEFGVRAGTDQGIKPLPKGCQRIAMLVWDYKDVTLNSSSLTGSSAFATVILESQGYSVVEVLLHEFNTYSTVVKKVQFLQQKIHEKLKKK